MIGVGLVAGARYPGGAPGVLVTVLVTVLLAVGFGSFSNAVALMVRSRESLIGIAQFLTLPLSFLSTAIMAEEAAPGWIRTVARVNPVNWAVSASRDALSADPDWAAVLTNCGLLLVLAIVLAFLATRAFRAYQRSV